VASFARRNNRIAARACALFTLIDSAPTDQLLVNPGDPDALLVMFDNARQFGFPRQVLVLVLEFIFIDGGYPVNAVVIRNFEQVD
jgi:hypothetical protein